MTQEKILDRLAKLKAARDGEARLGNSAAAEAFAGMINKMLLEHELTEVDIPVDATEPIIELPVDLKLHGIKASRVRVGWQEALARVVADAHLCTFLVRPGSNWVAFVGTKPHAAVAEYAYGVLVAAADKMSWDAREEWWRTECGGEHLESGNFRGAWLTGFVGRIAERFAEARRKEVRAAGSATMALVRLEGALAGPRSTRRSTRARRRRSTCSWATATVTAPGERRRTRWPSGARASTAEARGS